MNKIVNVPGATGFLLADSADLQPGKTYTLKGERSDGIETVNALNTVSFQTPKSSGTDDFSIQSGLSVYPVPSAGRITIRADFANPVQFGIEIRSLHGQQMYSAQQQAYGTFIRVLDISGYPKGIYLISIIELNSSGIPIRETRKIIRE